MQAVNIGSTTIGSRILELGWTWLDMRLEETGEQ